MKKLNKYYEEEYDGEISAKHILIKVKDSSDENAEGLSDDEAKKKANDLIKKIR